jgi:Colicin immunity protein / pyocin immunity protein
MSHVLNRSELIILVRKIAECEGNEEEINEWLAILKEHVSHPSVSDLIFYSEKELSPEEIVDEALAYKPYLLG